jgi:hypothetical protein
LGSNQRSNERYYGEWAALGRPWLPCSSEEKRGMKSRSASGA